MIRYCKGHCFEQKWGDLKGGSPLSPNLNMADRSGQLDLQAGTMAGLLHAKCKLIIIIL